MSHTFPPFLNDESKFIESNAITPRGFPLPSPPALFAGVAAVPTSTASAAAASADDDENDDDDEDRTLLFQAIIPSATRRSRNGAMDGILDARRVLVRDLRQR